MGEEKILLTDEEGNEYTLILMGFTEYKGVTYAVFTPEDAPDGEGEEPMPVIVMTAELKDDNPIFNLVEDEDLGNAVLEKFMEEDEERGED